MHTCQCRKCRKRTEVHNFPGVCPHCNYLLTEKMIVVEPEQGSAEAELRRYCQQKGINPDGQFIEEDGYLFTDGFKLGRQSASSEPCNCGDCDQSRSNSAFYTKKLFEEASKLIKIDPENTSWFEVMDLMGKEIKALRYDLQVAHSVINANKG